MNLYERINADAIASQQQPATAPLTEEQTAVRGGIFGFLRPKLHYNAVLVQVEQNGNTVRWSRTQADE